MSFDPDTVTDEELEENSITRDLLEEILETLQRIEAHLATITDEELEQDDVD